MRRFLLASLGLLVVLGVAGPLSGAESDGDGVFEFGSLNRRYTELAPDLAPLTQGGVTVRLASPRHQLDLRFNRLELRPREDGSYDLDLQLEFEGGGHLVADLDVSGVVSRLEDELTVPRQRRTVVARVFLRRAAEGYMVTPTELPEAFEVEIESRVAAQLVGACRSLAALGLGLVDCGGLQRGLSRVVIPMPPPGETYLLEGERLSDEDRRRLDAFLARHAPPAPPRR